MSRMIHLLLNVMIRILLICMLVVSAVLVLQRQPVPDLVQPGFSACDLPCWAGVVPGETRYVDAEKTITANIDNIRLQFPDFLAEVPTSQILDARGEVFGAVFEDRGMVGGVRLDFRVPLWQLLEVVGTPMCLQDSLMGADMHTYSIYWQVDGGYVMGIVLIREAADWRLDQSTASVFIYDGSDPCVGSSAFPWQGFGGFNPRRMQ